MNNKAWRKLAFATGGIVLSVASLQVSPAWAGGLTTYDFTVTNLTGVLTGKTFDGSFTFSNANFKSAYPVTVLSVSSIYPLKKP